jgi:hypothetical protein
MGHAVSWEMERSASGSACFLQLIYTVSKYLSLFSKKYQVATNPFLNIYRYLIKNKLECDKHLKTDEV